MFILSIMEIEIFLSVCILFFFQMLGCYCQVAPTHYAGGITGKVCCQILFYVLFNSPCGEESESFR